MKNLSLQILVVSLGLGLVTFSQTSSAYCRKNSNGNAELKIDNLDQEERIRILQLADGKVVDVTALDVGARLVVLDEERRIVRLEEAGRRIGAALGLKLEPGAVLAERDARALAASMAESLFEAMRGGSPKAGGAGLLRLDPLTWRGDISDVSFSGGVSVVWEWAVLAG